MCASYLHKRAKGERSSRSCGGSPQGKNLKCNLPHRSLCVERARSLQRRRFICSKIARACLHHTNTHTYKATITAKHLKTTTSASASSQCPRQFASWPTQNRLQRERARTLNVYYVHLYNTLGPGGGNGVGVGGGCCGDGHVGVGVGARSNRAAKFETHQRPGASSNSLLPVVLAACWRTLRSVASIIIWHFVLQVYTIVSW